MINKDESSHQIPVSAWRYKDPDSASKDYDPIQELLMRSDLETSVYRFTLAGEAHLALVGEALPANLPTLLVHGESTSLPEDVEEHLRARRAAAIKVAPWVEIHHKPEEERGKDNKEE